MRLKAFLFCLSFSMLTCGLVAEDSSDPKPRRETEDPSYEPARAVRARGSVPRAEIQITQTTPESSTLSVKGDVQLSSGARVKYILDGKPVYDGDVPISGATVSSGQTPYTSASSENDLTADKPGTAPAAEDHTFLDDMQPDGHVNSRAGKCYKLLSELKSNIETISRCLDNRGKENARLVHASEEVLKNVTDMAAIWPKQDEFIEHCANLKRCALVFNDELNQSPWKWSEVRWSFEALLKSARSYREFCRAKASLERPPHAIYDKKGNVTWEDEADPSLNTPAAILAAKIKLDQEEIAKHRVSEKPDETRKRLKTDLNGN